MDKELIGKWYKEEMGETINIFDELPLRIKMSFSSSGYYNFEPNNVYIKDEYLCFEINDEQNRMVYHIKYESNTLIGFYTQHGKTIDIKYIRVSNIPDDDEFIFKPTQLIVPNTNITRHEILKQYAVYSISNSNKKYKIVYKMLEPIPDNALKYDFKQYVENIPKNDDRLAFAILDFVCDNFKHDGSSGLPRGRKVKDIISFCEKHNNSVNCRGLAIMLASLLRMNGIKAKHVTCRPYEEPFDDCHVVVDCTLPSDKRIMFDPTYRLYLKDKNNDYISLQKLRTMLINDEEYYANSNASYNNGDFDIKYQREYMIKNTFRFSQGILNSDGLDECSPRKVELIPLNYSIDKFDKTSKAAFVYNENVFWQ